MEDKVDSKVDNKTDKHVPPTPHRAFRVVLELHRTEKRLDQVLLEALRAQKQDLNLQQISRTAFKELFNSGRIRIKGQQARPSSAVAKGLTYIDILVQVPAS